MLLCYIFIQIISLGIRLTPLYSLEAKQVINNTCFWALWIDIETHFETYLCSILSETAKKEQMSSL